MAKRTTLVARRMTLAVCCTLSLLPASAFAWGPLGHRIAAENAALLLARDPNNLWGDLMSRHRFELGVYSTFPDSYFRYTDGTVEGPTHYFNIDVALAGATTAEKQAAALEAIPHDTRGAYAYFSKTLGVANLGSLGTAPWRISELRILADREMSTVKAFPGGYIRGAAPDTPPDAKHIFQAMYYLGLLSHYVADATMPFHSTYDTNGWNSGEGGIHTYYENDCVGALDIQGLSEAAYRMAEREERNWLNTWRQSGGDPAGVMIKLFYESAIQLGSVKKADKDKVITKASDGQSKTPAERRPVKNGCEAFKSFIIEDLAKASVATAYLWNGMIPKGADVQRIRSLQFSDMLGSVPYVTPSFLKN